MIVNRCDGSGGDGGGDDDAGDDDTERLVVVVTVGTSKRWMVVVMMVVVVLRGEGMPWEWSVWRWWSESRVRSDWESLYCEADCASGRAERRPYCGSCFVCV